MVLNMLILITLWELGLVLLCTAFMIKKCMCMRRGGKQQIYKIIVLCLSLILSFILGGQLSALFVTGRYVDVLTLSNLYSYSDVGWKIVLSSASIILICLGVTLFVAIATKKGRYKHISWPIILYCLVFWCINPQGAIYSFGKTCYGYFDQSFYTPNAKIRKIQQQIYAQNITYNNKFDAQKVMDLRNKNIVVVFAEGFSFQWIDKFNKYKDLTPNLDQFLETSVYFDNYYNHTAATFRGLRGQLTSSYQLRSGYVKAHNGLGQISEAEIKQSLTGNLVSIPHILKNNSYSTYFLSTHPSTHQLNMVLKTLEFDTVFGADSFTHTKQTGKNLTDQQLFSALGDFINNDKLKKPFFIGTYNIGTHLGQNSPDVKYADGSNILLNTIHNFDDAFGKFWQSVKDRKDLVIILTADHAAYPSELYDKTFSTHRKYPVDKIPFAVWYNSVNPTVFDAQGRNSLDFAPTLLQAMGIRQAFNYFLGCSLFSAECSKEFDHIHSEGGGLFLLTPSLRKLDNRNADDKAIIQKIRDFFNLSEDRRFI